MSQRRSYPNSGDFNLDDLFRPEPGQPQGQPGPPQGPTAVPPVGQPSGQPEYLGEGGHSQQQWGAVPQPGYGVPPQADPAPATQHLPPYPAGDPQGGGYPAPQPGYGVPPQAAPGYQGYPPAAQPQPPQQPQQPGYPAQGYGQGGYGQGGYGQDPDATQGGRSGSGGRPSNKLVIGGVVAVCAVAGVLVAVLMSGNDDTAKSGQKTTPVAATGGTASAAASASGSGAAADPDVKAQAQPLSDLLGTASDSRSAVVSAVASVQKCDKLPDSQQALSAAAGKRRELQSKLGQLKTDKLPGGQQLIDQLNAAWTASAQADDEYAAWATDAQSSCDPKKPDTGNQHYKNAVQASGTATTAKKQASTLWNAIATQTGLPPRGDGDL
ncbi:hypothetical protein [Kitasatospora cathayae]|uniref:Uncharacterized protein n=1 Tax=Kitasatospora cathayae TaxID=3004092 RepID=A0ABY7Q464_9ACTN|nr:hypothetical protein [Kitasatospora sp. HUAS 3-15]WBP87419.1 hypothetical protein O1G21_17260 [Kitasatospora sp. HUAS 3-15]